MWTPFDGSKEQYRDFERSFKRKARFLVDENMGEDAARLLSDIGYNTVFVGDVDLIGKSDEAVFAYAWRKGRFILTHDGDFLDDGRFPFHRNPGVIVLPGATGDGTLEIALADVVRILAPFADAHVGAKISVTPDRTWTIRNFLRNEGKHVQTRVKLEPHGNASIWSDPNENA